MTKRFAPCQAVTFAVIGGCVRQSGADDDLTRAIELQPALVEAAGRADAGGPDLQRGWEMLATFEDVSPGVGTHDLHTGAQARVQAHGGARNDLGPGPIPAAVEIQHGVGTPDGRAGELDMAPAAQNIGAHEKLGFQLAVIVLFGVGEIEAAIDA